VLKAIKNSDLGETKCSDITSNMLVSFAQDLNQSVEPQTCGNYFSHLSSIFTVARPAWGFPLSRQAFDDAVTVVKKLGLIRKVVERSRRPTLEELDRLMEHFGRIRDHRPSSIPMQTIVAFAIFSTRRQEEITLLRWEDLDGDRILVRDMKHPGDKKGNNVYCELSPEALAIIGSMPRTATEIFPYSAEAISAAFTRACYFLGIKDLRFHDLRHEGVSRLFEIGKPYRKQLQFPDIDVGPASNAIRTFYKRATSIPTGDGRVSMGHNSCCGKSLISSEANRGHLDRGACIRLPDFFMSLIKAS
jgi:integrase